MKLLIITLALATLQSCASSQNRNVAQAAPIKPDQCVILRDDYKTFEMEIPQQTSVVVAKQIKIFDVPKKITPAPFRQLVLPASQQYSAKFMLRNVKNKKTAQFSVSASNYISGQKTEEYTYYKADVLPRIYIQTEKNEIVISGNKFTSGPEFIGTMELHVIPCDEVSTNSMFSSGPETVVKSLERPSVEEPDVYQ